MSALPLPGSGTMFVAMPAPGTGPQWWAGAPSALELPDGTFVIAYRVRRGSGEDDEVVLARSDDGVALTTVGIVDKLQHNAAMTERPALVRLDDGRWRLYASFATPGTFHWWVGVLEADTFEELASAPQTPVFPGSADIAVKDPVVRRTTSGWEAWLCLHPLDIPGEEDRMESAFSTSEDGLAWSPAVTVLSGRPGAWDARGTRMTAVLPDGSLAFDGRASKEENWFERTGIARPNGDGTFTCQGEPVSTARYLEVLPLRDGGWRIWYEQVLPDESHDLRTEIISPA